MGVFHELSEMSEQSDNNRLNKKDFVLIVFGTGHIAKVFQVKGIVFPFRDHVNN